MKYLNRLDIGFSLIQTLMAVAIMSIATIALMKMAQMNTKSNKTFEVRNEEIYFLNEIRNILSNPNSCAETLAGKDPVDSRNNPPAIDGIYSEAGVKAIDLNQPYGQAKLILIEAWLSDSPSEVNVANKNTYLFLRIDRGRGVNGPRIINKKIKINFEIDPDNNKIKTCISSSTGSGSGGGSSVWQVNADGEAIYPTSGAAVGTNDTNAGFEVAAKDIFASQSGKGLILKSPDGTKCVRFYLDNDLNLKKRLVDCTTLENASAQLIEDNGAKRWADGTKSASCKEYLENPIYPTDPNKGDGSYWIDLDGSGSSPEFRVYCDMTNDTGGWTLVVGIDPTNKNHNDTNDVNGANLYSLNAKGKFSDAVINQIKTDAFRFECRGLKQFFDGNLNSTSNNQTNKCSSTYPVSSWITTGGYHAHRGLDTWASTGSGNTGACGPGGPTSSNPYLIYSYDGFNGCNVRGAASEPNGIVQNQEGKVWVK